MIVLAGDIGGTNARLAIFSVERASAGDKPTLTSLLERTYPSTSRPTLEAIVQGFLDDARASVGVGGGGGGGGAAAGGAARAIQRACLGIAGPVENNICRATNLPWVVDGKALVAQLGIERVQLVKSAPDNGYQVIASEGGHADLAPRTPLEMGLLHFLTAKYGRVSYERVLSGHGLVDVFTFLSQEPACATMVRDDTRAALAAQGPGHDPAAVISRRGLDGSDPVCEMALAIFCSVLGALAGNLGLYALASGGVFIAGGIAPRVLPYLQRGGFREAFERKGRMTPLVARLPAFVVTHPQPGLLGAAIIAAAL